MRCGEDFLTRLIGPSISHHKREVSWLLGDNSIFQYNKQAKAEDFYVKTQIGKTTGMKERIHDIIKVTINSAEYYYVFNFSDAILFHNGRPGA